MKGEMAEERARESEGVRKGEEVGGGERERERERMTGRVGERNNEREGGIRKELEDAREEERARASVQVCVGLGGYRQPELTERVRGKSGEANSLSLSLSLSPCQP
jgi:hypothetical protein